MKKLLIIPILFCLFIAIVNIANGNVFVFGLWLLISAILSTAIIPILLGTDDKDVPIYQIFIILPILLLVFSIVAVQDFIKIGGQPLNEAFIYGIGVGLASIGAIMIVKGK